MAVTPGVASMPEGGFVEGKGGVSEVGAGAAQVHWAHQAARPSDNSAFPASARSGLRESRRAAWGTRGTLAEIMRG